MVSRRTGSRAVLKDQREASPGRSSRSNSANQAGSWLSDPWFQITEKDASGNGMCAASAIS